MGKVKQLIQNDNIGDVIICLPIAQYYTRAGYSVRMVVRTDILTHFNKGHFNDIQFTDTVDHDESVIDLSYKSNREQYLDQDEYTFDEFKYSIAKVPFQYKWSLEIKRDKDRELDLYNSLNIQSEYDLIHEVSSDYKLQHELYSETQLVYIEPKTDCIFDWIHTIENARALLFVESCFSNLVDQLAISNKSQYILHTPDRDCGPTRYGHPKGRPILHNPWMRLTV